MNFFIIVPPKTAFPSRFRGKGELSQEKRIFSRSCDIKTIALFNIFVKTSPNFREIAAFAWHFFVNDAQLTFLKDLGSVENGKFEVLENMREQDETAPASAGTVDEIEGEIASPERGGGPQGRRGSGLAYGRTMPQAEYWAP